MFYQHVLVYPYLRTFSCLFTYFAFRSKTPLVVMLLHTTPIVKLNFVMYS